MLASSNFLSSCETPIVSCHKVVFDCQAIELEEFSKLNLSHNCDVEVPEGLNLRIKRLSVFVEFVHVLVFEQIFLESLSCKYISALSLHVIVSVDVILICDLELQFLLPQLFFLFLLVVESLTSC